MYSIDISQLLKCGVALHFKNTWEINDLTFEYYWKQLQLRVWRYVSVTDVFIRVALYLTITHSICSTSCPQNRNAISNFSGTGRSTNSIAWKRWILWNNWLLQWSKKRTIVMSKTSRFTGKGGSTIDDRGSGSENRGSRIRLKKLENK